MTMARRLRAHHGRLRGKNQMSQAQWRAKRGAAATLGETVTTGEIEAVAAVGITQTTVAGTGDKIWICEPVGTVAVTGGCGTEDGLAAQHGIVPA